MTEADVLNPVQSVVLKAPTVSTRLRQIDAMAQELRARTQSGKTLMAWEFLPYARKKKWLDHATALHNRAIALAEKSDV